MSKTQKWLLIGRSSFAFLAFFFLAYFVLFTFIGIFPALLANMIAAGLLGACIWGSYRPFQHGALMYRGTYLGILAALLALPLPVQSIDGPEPAQAVEQLATSAPEPAKAPQPKSTPAPPASNKLAPVQPGLSDMDRIILVSRAKDTITARLRDPSSAQFRKIYAKGTTICGEVNSKNGLGGYSGFQSFIAGGAGTIVFLEEDTAPGEFVKVWNKFCAGKGAILVEE